MYNHFTSPFNHILHPPNKSFSPCRIIGFTQYWKVQVLCTYITGGYNVKNPQELPFYHTSDENNVRLYNANGNLSPTAIYQWCKLSMTTISQC